MNYKEFNYAVPIKDNNVVIIDGIVQYDTANILNIRLMDGTEPFDFTGYTEVFLEIVKPDGTHIQACITDDETINNDNNPYTIQVADAKEGRISFTLHGQATILTGTHFAQITILAGGKMLTSARLNYYVGDTLMSDTDPQEVLSSSEYPSLIVMIARNSAIATEERQRVDSEMLRKLAELAREERMSDLEDYINEYLQNAVGYVDQTKNYMDIAQKYAQLAQNPSAEILEDLIQSLNLASKDYVDDEVADNTKDFDAGSFTDSEADKRLLKARRGLAADLPALEEGEFGYATDTKTVYVGSSAGNVPISGVYVRSNVAPSRTDLLWIDSSAGDSIKYHDGTAWKPTATATFA